MGLKIDCQFFFFFFIDDKYSKHASHEPCLFCFLVISFLPWLFSSLSDHSFVTVKFVCLHP